MKSGQFLEILKTCHSKTAEAGKLGPRINDTWASIIDSFFDEQKYSVETKRLIKAYPRVENIEKAGVPKLESELFSAIDQYARAADVALQNIQKGLVTVVSAMAPIGAVMLERGDTDPELDKFSSNMVDGVHLLAMTSLAVSARRRELMKPQIQATYAPLAKATEGSSEWLYGGNLSEKLAEKIVKKKTNHTDGASNGFQKRGPNQNNKRFKNSQGHWGAKKQQKTFGYQHLIPQQFGFFNPQ